MDSEAPWCLRLFADGVVDNPGPIANVLPLARALVSLLQPAQPLGLLLACSLAPCVKSLLRHQCGAVAAADTTCMVVLPWPQCLGPKCPCAGSLALKALIEAEVSYTLTSFASSRGHESPGYPDRQRPLCLAGLSCCCSWPQAQ